MTFKRIIGALMVATPFIAMFLGLGYERGWGVAITVFAGMAMAIGFMLVWLKVGLDFLLGD